MDEQLQQSAPFLNSNPSRPLYRSTAPLMARNLESWIDS